jgi:hypothetical protein
MFLDAIASQQAFGHGANGYVVSTHSELGPVRTSYVLSAMLQEVYALQPLQLGYQRSDKLRYFERNTSSDIHTINADATMSLAVSDRLTFQYFLVAPVLPNGWSFFGELDKWVSVSADRFSGLMAADDGFRVEAKGVAGEVLRLGFADTQGRLQEAECVVGATNTVMVMVDETVVC